jgi:hypothetical protein
MKQPIFVALHRVGRQISRSVCGRCQSCTVSVGGSRGSTIQTQRMMDRRRSECNNPPDHCDWVVSFDSCSSVLDLSLACRFRAALIPTSNDFSSRSWSVSETRQQIPGLAAILVKSLNPCTSSEGVGVPTWLLKTRDFNSCRLYTCPSLLLCFTSVRPAWIRTR